ncbi:unnamed protein product [Timema podura]|uniref:Uncharacterized protein n=1 Tax=Timema podura TaxID=61482 RepID=A0ABN7NHX3_TIMPD|nr:unnamed protein product [Timema podura]
MTHVLNASVWTGLYLPRDHKSDMPIKSLRLVGISSSHQRELQFEDKTRLNVFRTKHRCGFISSLSGVVTKSEQVDKLKQFIEDNQDALGSSAVTSATNTLVSAERNLAWLDAHAQTIAAWINATDTTTVAPGGGGGGAPSSYSSTTVLLMLLLSTVSCWIGRF